MPKKCNPSRYAVIGANRQNITYGFRCAKHGVHTKRYSTAELRETRRNEHIESNKKQK